MAGCKVVGSFAENDVKHNDNSSIHSLSFDIVFHFFRRLWKQFLFKSYDNVFAQFKLHIRSLTHRCNGTILSKINAFGAAFLNADELMRMHLLQWFIMVCRVCYLFHISMWWTGTPSPRFGNVSLVFRLSWNNSCWVVVFWWCSGKKKNSLHKIAHTVLKAGI